MAGVADLTGDLGKALWEPAWQKMSLVLGCPLSPGTVPLSVSWRKLAVGSCANA